MQDRPIVTMADWYIIHGPVLLSITFNKCKKTAVYTQVNSE